MVKVSVADIENMFRKVLSGEVTRDYADRWAYNLTQALDNADLNFDPPSEEERIWKGIMYLFGIDMQTAPNEFLHSEEDIREAMFRILFRG